MQVSESVGVRMQPHPAALLRRVVTVDACNDVLRDYLAGVRDSAIQVGIRPELFDHVDFHFYPEAAQFKVFRTNPDHDLTCRSPDFTWQLDRPIPQRDSRIDDWKGEQIHRRRSDESGHKDVRRVTVKLAWRRELLQQAVAQYCDAVTHRHGLDLVMGDIDRRGFEPALQGGDLIAGLYP